MNIRIPLTAALIGASLLSMPLAASAQDTIVVETITATTYLNGGVGQTESDAIRRIAKEFPLRLTFSERQDKEFITDVPVVISDARGNPVFALPNAGPLLYVMLPDGKYKVSARFKGLTESRDVTLAGKNGEDVNFHWKSTPTK